MEIETINAVSFFVAFAAGVISFLSPCVLPLVPGYVSLITGLDLAEVQEGSKKHAWAVFRDTGTFVLGFGSVFVLLGVSATSIGGLLRDHQLLLTQLSGALVLAMSLFLLGSIYLQAPWLYREARFHPQLGRFGRAAPGVAGVAFGFGWTPCIGPVLTSILAIAATSGRASTGAALLGVYSLGLGLPFLLTGLALSRIAGALGWVKRHFTGVVITSSIFLAFFGVLLTLNRFVWLTTQLSSLLRAVGLEWIVELG